jgi:hypothetical protein
VTAVEVANYAIYPSVGERVDSQSTTSVTFAPRGLDASIVSQGGARRAQ